MAVGALITPTPTQTVSKGKKRARYSARSASPPSSTGRPDRATVAGSIGKLASAVDAVAHAIQSLNAEPRLERRKAAIAWLRDKEGYSPPTRSRILHALKHDTDLCEIICDTASDDEGEKEMMVADLAM